MKVSSKDRTKKRLKYDYGHEVRTNLYQECYEPLKEFKPSKSNTLNSDLKWEESSSKSYAQAIYPQSDICKECLAKTISIIVIADQAFTCHGITEQERTCMTCLIQADISSSLNRF